MKSMYATYAAAQGLSSADERSGDRLRRSLIGHLRVERKAGCRPGRNRSFVKIAVTALTMAICTSSVTGQFDASNTPDVSVALSRVSVPDNGGGALSSGLAVPSVRPGETARQVGRRLRASLEMKNGGKPYKSLARLEE
ncbi:MAG: hypothetical protein H7145_19550 [Akkermansiaceae bacterium]|nr:hypothetical protein [Armatimonadota bacterium]